MNRTIQRHPLAVAFFVVFLFGGHAAYAAPKLAVQPIQVGEETVRYFKGTPTVDLRLPGGAVQVTPVDFDHGGISFIAVAWNGSSQAANFGVEHIEVTTMGKKLAVLTKDQLVEKAENRAAWAQFGVALLGGLAAASAASSQQTAYATTYTPRGVYSTSITYRNPNADFNTAATLAGTGVALAAIQRSLDRTREALADQIVQTTTIDPTFSYGGRVVVEKIKGLRTPQIVEISIRWNDTVYPFRFQVAKRGTPPPVFTRLTPAEPVQAAATPVGTPTAQSPVAVAYLEPMTEAEAMGPPRRAANTPSGFCYDVPRSYGGSGSLKMPALTSAKPACYQLPAG